MGTWEHGSSGIGCSLDGLGYSPFLLNSDDAENKWADLKCVFYSVFFCVHVDAEITAMTSI